MKNLNTFIIAIFLTIGLIFPAIGYAQQIPGGGSPGPIGDLQDQINAEADARIAADALLQQAVDDEQDARIAGDNALDQSIDDEEAARISGDGDLQDQIDTLGDEQIIVLSKSTTLGVPAAANWLYECPESYFAIGGSCWFDKDPVANNTDIINDGPAYGLESWNCYVVNNSAVGPIVLTITTICKPGPRPLPPS